MNTKCLFKQFQWPKRSPSQSFWWDHQLIFGDVPSVGGPSASAEDVEATVVAVVAAVVAAVAVAALLMASVGATFE